MYCNTIAIVKMSSIVTPNIGKLIAAEFKELHDISRVSSSVERDTLVLHQCFEETVQ